MPLSANGIPVQKLLPLLCNNCKKKKSKSWTAIKPIKKQVGLFYSYIKNNLLSQNNVQLEAVQTTLNTELESVWRKTKDWITLHWTNMLKCFKILTWSITALTMNVYLICALGRLSVSCKGESLFTFSCHLHHLQAWWPPEWRCSVYQCRYPCI